MPSNGAAEEAWGYFWRIFQADKPRRMKVLGALGLHFQQAMALTHLEPGTPLPMSALATALQCDNSNVTGIVDRLEAAGLAERRPAEHDRRVKTIVLTPHGSDLREQLMAKGAEPPPALAALSDEEATTLRDILAKAAATLDAPSA
jgi:DNA-binding MarR family transcriptional regulator